MTPLGKGRSELLSGIRKAAPVCPKSTTAFSSFTLISPTSQDAFYGSRLSGAVANLGNASKALEHFMTASSHLQLFFRQSAA